VPELTVGLGERAYPIHIGSGLLSRKELFAATLANINKAVVVTNSTVASHYLTRVQATLERLGVQCQNIILPDGEEYKDWQTLNDIFSALLQGHCERHTPLIALGGGVVGDVAGFAAASYQRGMPLVQLPTTLLAQVDSSVGGKTAINHPLGKNMIGAFYQPRLVVADIDTLTTLPARQLRAGLAEVIKYGLIRDADFFVWLEVHAEELLAQKAEVLCEAIERSCQHKAAVVAADERESGERALLNLGHTFGHAIETGAGYGNWLHGEAVAAGIVMAAQLSAQSGLIAQYDVERIKQLLRRCKLPVEGAAMPPQRYLELMRHDKKVHAGRLNLVLLSSIGNAVVSSYADADVKQIEAAIIACGGSKL